MSSVPRNQSQMTTNALYVNINNVSGNLFNADGTVNTALATAVGTANGHVFRDMGRTVYVPTPQTPNAVAMQSTILRKVQWVPTGAQGGFYGTGGAAGTVGSEFNTAYIALGGQTYAGGTGVVTVFARAN